MTKFNYINWVTSNKHGYLNEQFDYVSGSNPDLGLGNSGMGTGFGNGANATWNQSAYDSWSFSFGQTVLGWYFQGGMTKVCKALLNRYVTMSRKFNGSWNGVQPGIKWLNTLAAKIYHIYFLMSQWGCPVPPIMESLQKELTTEGTWSFDHIDGIGGGTGGPMGAGGTVNKTGSGMIMPSDTGGGIDKFMDMDTKPTQTYSSDNPPTWMEFIPPAIKTYVEGEVLSFLEQVKRETIGENKKPLNETYNWASANSYNCQNPGKKACDFLQNDFASWASQAPPPMNNGKIGWQFRLYSSPNPCNVATKKYNKINGRLTGFSGGPDHQALLLHKLDFWNTQKTGYC